jgi:hypothetical protein
MQNTLKYCQKGAFASASLLRALENSSKTRLRALDKAEPLTRTIPTIACGLPFCPQISNSYLVEN